MTNKKQKGAAELLIEKNRDYDRLSAKLTELESELNRYKSREADIAAAITMAAQAKSNIIAEAEKNAAAMLRNAESKAEATVAEAEKKADAIISDAENKAASIISEAKKTAESTISKTQKDTKAMLTAAKEQSDAINQHCTSINASLTKAAGDLYRYIKDFKGIYEEVTGHPFEDIPAANSTADSAIRDSYDTPEELFHAFMEIEGRQAPQEALDAISKLPESVPFSEKLFDGDDPAKKIEDIINLDIKQDKTAEPKDDAPTEADVENISIETNAQPEAVEAKNAAANTEQAEKEPELLESILQNFINNVMESSPDYSTSNVSQSSEQTAANDNETKAEAEVSTTPADITAEKEKIDAILDDILKDQKESAVTADSKDTDIDSILGDILGENTDDITVTNTGTADDLNTILNDIFGKTDEAPQSSEAEVAETQSK